MTHQSPDCPYLYFVFVDVHSVTGKAYLDWQDNKHIPEVLTDPAFLWVRKVLIGPQTKPDGSVWDQYIIVYGIKNLEVFKAYRNSNLFRKFGPELEKFEGTFSAKRFMGPVKKSIG